ncbi:MAG: hypothetical protein ACTTKH_00515 [Treponema sp.]
MKGINIKNFYESLEYNDKHYVIQPISEDGKSWLVIYLTNVCNDSYLVCEEIFKDYRIEKEVIDKVLNAKCFDGKSFFEIYNDIEIILWG